MFPHSPFQPGDEQRAVSILSDARLNRDYTTKVMQALSLAEDPHFLIRSYIRTVKPLLTEPDDIDMYTIALAESNLLEAWSYQRTYSEGDETRKRLICKILDWCLTRECCALYGVVCHPKGTTQRNHARPP